MLMYYKFQTIDNGGNLQFEYKYQKLTQIDVWVQLFKK